MERHILFQSKRSQSHKSSNYVTDVLIITVADQAQCPIEEMRLPERSWANIKGSKVVKSLREFLIHQQFQDDNINMIDLEEDDEEVPQVVIEPLICPLTEQQYLIFTTLVSPFTLLDSNIDEYWFKMQDSIRIYCNIIQQ